MARLLPADLAARALGISPSTLRVWRHRGLITPAGGTERNPLYALEDLHAARQAPKPRLTSTKAGRCGVTMRG
ncbi:MerR family transcriptional regulator [Streptomyces chartreusis]|uniref:MerR family transcriptional regulator n=1 Tax=Streptomyces chartreusis TaxID=1969 RepID=UPI0037119179